MRKIIFVIISLMFISSFGVSADDGAVKKYKLTRWVYDKELQQTTYYKDGEMVKNSWVDADGKKYYLKENGAVATGWQKLNNNWYHFTPSGIMETGWVIDDNNKWYFLNVDGTMAHDTYIGGYRVGSDGAWIK